MKTLKKLYASTSSWSVYQLIKTTFLITLLIFVMNTLAEDGKTDPAYGAISIHRVSDSPSLQLPDNMRNWPAITSPATMNDGPKVDDQRATVIYDVTSGKTVQIPSKEFVPDGSAQNTAPYNGLLHPGMISESVIGTDGRVRVTPTTTFPWRSIVKLYITAKDGARFSGSGAIIGRGDGNGFHVLTCGHCVYLHDHGGWASAIKIVPGLDRSYMPYNYANTTKMRSYTGWTTSKMREHDWAVLTLDRRIGNHVGWMGRITASKGNSLYTGILNSAGYPGDRGGGIELFRDSDNGRVATDYNHWYYMDTGKGQSGMPIWRFIGPDKRHVCTVHAYGNDGSGSNHGTRLNQDKYDRIIAWTDADTLPTDRADLIDDGESKAGFSPKTVTHGASVINLWSDVRNVGTASSGGFNVSYYASADTTITKSDYLIGTDSVLSVSPFAYRDSSWNGTVPGSIPPGAYWVGWIIDSGSAVTEFDEGNNVAHQTGYKLVVEGLDPPAGLAATDGAYANKVKVSWNSVTDASHYCVYRATSSGGTKSPVSGWQTGTTFDNTSVTPGQIYYYWAKAAVNSSGDNASDYSAEDPGFAMLTAEPAGDWKYKDGKKTDVLKGKELAPSLIPNLIAGGQVGLASVAPDGTLTSVNGPHSLENKKDKDKLWFIKKKKELIIKYKAKKDALTYKIWGQMPESKVIYVLPPALVSSTLSESISKGENFLAIELIETNPEKTDGWRELTPVMFREE